MPYLAIDTSSSLLSLTLCDDQGNTLAKRSHKTDLNHAAELIPGLRLLLEDAGQDKRDIKGVVVALGPGSFTGIRIGVTCANTLAYGLGVPVIGIGTLPLMAQNALNHYGELITDDQAIEVFLDAGREELYCQRFLTKAHADNASLVSQSELFILPLAELSDSLKPGDLVVGKLRQAAIELVQPILQRTDITPFIALDQEINLTPALIKLGLPMFTEKQAFSMQELVSPLYGREAYITQSKKFSLPRS